MHTITQNKLAELLSTIVTAQPITITAFVDARLRKINNPFSEVRKLSKVNGFTGIDYEKSVNRQLGREDKDQSFVASPRAWGERIAPCLVTNKGKLYLVLKVQHAARPIYFARSSFGDSWLSIDRSKIESLLPNRTHSANQGTDKEIVYRNYALSTLRSVSMLGCIYKVAP
jgi:hypothetical protein